MKTITDQAELGALCVKLRASGRFGVDLEFIREKSYFPIICLVQLSTADEQSLVDPMSGIDLAPLRELVLDGSVVKILHAGGQDLELLVGRERPAGIFDTQIAASFLGMGDAIGYAELCRRVLGVTIRKTGQVADWDRRPLAPKLLNYAAGDVEHLPVLHDRLTEGLQRDGRLAWAQEECDRMAERAAEAPPEAWQRVKGGGQAEGRELAVLACLAEWREGEAARRDQPRQRILNDRTLIELARQVPHDRGALSVSRFFPPDKVNRYGEAILRAVKDGLSLPEKQWPRRPEGGDAPPVPQPTLDFLAVYAKVRAEAVGIGAARLATREDVADLAAAVLGGNAEGARLMHGWRWECVGKELAALLKGKVALRVRNRRLESFEVK